MAPLLFAVGHHWLSTHRAKLTREPVPRRKWRSPGLWSVRAPALPPLPNDQHHQRRKEWKEESQCLGQNRKGQCQRSARAHRKNRKRCVKVTHPKRSVARTPRVEIVRRGFIGSEWRWLGLWWACRLSYREAGFLLRFQLSRGGLFVGVARWRRVGPGAIFIRPVHRVQGRSFSAASQALPRFRSPICASSFRNSTTNPATTGDWRL